MLVLSRKQGQTIQIDDRITITITQLKGKQVRVGIDAPREMSIRRGELTPNVKPDPQDPSATIATFETAPGIGSIMCSLTQSCRP